MAEDGVIVLPSVIRSAWLAMLEPVNGYLILPTKLVAWIALNVSFDRYPNVSTGLSILTEAACAYAVLASPTILRHRQLCALAVVLVPIAPEVFAAPLYLFWWTSLLGVVALLWSSDRLQSVRSFFIVISALSSPLLLALVPVFAVVAAARRARSDLVALVVAVLSCGVQLWIILAQSGLPLGSVLLSLERPLLILLKYFALPVAYLHLQDVTVLIVLGLTFSLATLFVLALAFLRAGAQRGEIALLLVIIAVAIATSIARAPITITSPWYGGPRYFFFATVFLAWALIWVAGDGTKVAFLARVLLALHLPVAALSFLDRSGPEVVSWQDQVTLCKAASGNFSFSIPTTGNPAQAWSVTLSGQTCRQLSEGSLFKGLS